MAQAVDVTATGTVQAMGPGTVRGIHLVAAGAAATLVLRDGGASGRVLARLAAVAGGADDIAAPIAYATDVHATLGGTGAAAVVLF